MGVAMDLKITGGVIGLLAALLTAAAGVAAAKVVATKAPVGTATVSRVAPRKANSAKGETGAAQVKTDQATALANAAVPEAERLSIQADLAMVGDYEGPAGGDFDARTLAAIKTFRQRNGGKDTGLLSEPERALLAAAAQRRGQASGWRVIEDVATGAQFGLPATLVPQSTPTRTGSRWTSAHGQITVETFRLQDAALPALFDSERTARRRQAEWSALKPDAFVLSGEQGLKRFTVRAQSRGSELRGITILYDQATAGTMDHLATAMADSFDGFPDPTRAAPGLRRSVEYGTAIAVTSRGDFIAPAKLTAQCQAIVIAGLGYAERIAEDGASDLALLRVNGAQGVVAAAIVSTAAAPDEVTLVGIADPRLQDGNANQNGVTRSSARLTGQALNPAPALGFSGAAAADPQGRFAGMVDLQAAAEAGAASQATLVPADTIRDFLIAQGIAAAPGDGVAEQSVRRVICVRK